MKSHTSRKPRPPAFRLVTGSDKAKVAAKDIIARTKAASRNLKVRFIDPGTNKVENRDFVEIFNNTDFDRDGLRLMAAADSHTLPMVKVIKVQEMIKEYTDKLAAEKEQELLEMGSYAAQRSVQRKMQAERKKSATKLVTLTWAISILDLSNQKRSEIQSRAVKDEKFVIYIGEKDSLYHVRNNLEKADALANSLSGSSTKWHRMDEDALAIEMKKREKVLECLKGVLEDLECKYEISGDVETRVKVNVTAKPGNKTNVPKVEANSRRQRLSERAEKAETSERPSKAAVSEEDLDSMYSFKIE